MDLSQVTAAPWEVRLSEGRWPYIPHPDGMPMLLPEDDGNEADIAALKFAALARNALDVMMRRGWSPVKSPVEGEGWRVDTNDGEYFCTTSELANNRQPNHWPHPFVALVEADKWQKGWEERRGKSCG